MVAMSAFVFKVNEDIAVRKMFFYVPLKIIGKLCGLDDGHVAFYQKTHIDEYLTAGLPCTQPDYPE